MGNKLSLIDPRIYDDTTLGINLLLEWFQLANAYWMYEGEPSPEKPHAELTTGLCSNGYFNCPELLKFPNICEVLGRQLGMLLREQGIKDVDWVISSAYAAITFGHEVAKKLGAIFANVEKDPTDPKKKRMLWQRMTIPAGATVLQVEELITTSGTFKEVRRAVEEGNQEPVKFLPTIGALVHRPPELPADYGEQKVVALIEKEVWAVEPSECGLCKVGSLRYRPKTNWQKLTG